MSSNVNNLDYTRRGVRRHFIFLFYWVFFPFDNSSRVTYIVWEILQLCFPAKLQQCFVDKKLYLTFNRHEGEKITEFSILDEVSL